MVISQDRVREMRKSRYRAGGDRLAERMRKANPPMIDESNATFRGRGAMRRKKPKMSGARAVNRMRGGMPTANYA